MIVVKILIAYFDEYATQNFKLNGFINLIYKLQNEY